MVGNFRLEVQNSVIEIPQRFLSISSTHISSKQVLVMIVCYCVSGDKHWETLVDMKIRTLHHLPHNYHQTVGYVVRIPKIGAGT